MTEAGNAQVIADLERRYRRATAIFYGSLASIPLGLICPCGLAALVYRVEPGWSQAVALSGFFLPLVGVAGALLVVGDRSRSRRSLALARLADALGLRFTHQLDRGQLDFLLSFPVLNWLRVPHSGTGVNRMEGTYRRRPLVALDYSFLGLLGYKHFVSHQTVAVFTAGFGRLPEFAVLPQTWADRFEQSLLGTSPGETFKVPGEREFNRHFVAVGADRDAVLGCLGPGVLDLFLGDRRLALEVHDGMLLVYRRETVLRAEDYEDFLAQAGRMAGALERAGEGR